MLLCVLTDDTAGNAAHMKNTCCSDKLRTWSGFLSVQLCNFRVVWLFFLLVPFTTLSV